MKTTLRHTLISLACLGLSAGALADTAREAELAQRLDQLAAELDKVKSQLAELKKAKPAESAVDTAVINGAANGEGSAAPSAPATVLTSYGEINFNHYSKKSADDTGDMRRFVLGYQHRFDAKTKVVAELEVEHAVSSASDSGEVEVEQAYIERQLSQTLALRAGLFLVPAGLLNENHEPTAYFGVERNYVETAIIPSTWREGGVQLVANLDSGWTLQGGLSTSFNVNNWDASSDESVESTLGAIHQELSQAKSHDMAVFGAANWRGVPGLLLGGSIFSGNVSQATTTTGRMRATLWDVHARYTPDTWDLSALYARGTISNTANFNLLSVGSDYLVPRLFDGGYVQVAKKVWAHEDYSLSPFVRIERFNTRAGYAYLGEGLTPSAAATETVWTMGANLAVGSGVVLKADWQRFKESSVGHRFDLGLGWSF